MQRRQRQHQSDGGAVGIGDHEAAIFLVPLLRLDQGNVVAVDFRDDERNIFRHAEGAGVRDHGMPCFGEGRLDLLRGGGIQRGKDQPGSAAIGRSGGNFHGRDLCRNRCGQVPLGGFGVCLAGRAV